MLDFMAFTIEKVDSRTKLIPNIAKIIQFGLYVKSFFNLTLKLRLRYQFLNMPHVASCSCIV